MKTQNKKQKKKIVKTNKSGPKNKSTEHKNSSRDMVEDLLIIKSISRDLAKIADTYNSKKKIHDSHQKNQELEQQKKDIYKLTYLIYKMSNKILGELK